MLFAGLSVANALTSAWNTLPVVVTLLFQCTTGIVVLFVLRSITVLDGHFTLPLSALLNLAPVVILTLLSIVASKRISFGALLVLQALGAFLVAGGEILLRDRAAPSFVSWLSLLGLLAASFFVLTDSHKSLIEEGSSTFVYLLSFSCEQLVLKKFSQKVDLTTFDIVLWSDLLSLPLLLLGLLFPLDGEFQFPSRAEDYYLLATSSLLATGMSYFGWELRKKMSALRFTVLVVSINLVTALLPALTKPADVNSVSVIVLGLILSGCYEEDRGAMVVLEHGSPSTNSDSDILHRGEAAEDESIDMEEGKQVKKNN
jgi:hypothetical protein